MVTSTSRSSARTHGKRRSIDNSGLYTGSSYPVRTSQRRLANREPLGKDFGDLETSVVSPTKKARFKRRFIGIRPWKRHSLVLFVAGFAYIGIGSSYIFAELTPSRAESLVVALRLADLHAWGIIWILGGVMSIISSRWPPVAETWGYMVLTGLAAGWGAAYALGVLIGDSPTTNLSAALIWSLVGFMFWAISGLVNPDGTGGSSNGSG